MRKDTASRISANVFARLGLSSAGLRRGFMGGAFSLPSASSNSAGSLRFVEQVASSDGASSCSCALASPDST
jgi:hypothetical protein